MINGNYSALKCDWYPTLTLLFGVQRFSFVRIGVQRFSFVRIGIQH
jgi:hypothetical protein